MCGAFADEAGIAFIFLLILKVVIKSTKKPVLFKESGHFHKLNGKRK